MIRSWVVESFLSIVLCLYITSDFLAGLYMEVTTGAAMKVVKRAIRTMIANVSSFKTCSDQGKKNNSLIVRNRKNINFSGSLAWIQVNMFFVFFCQQVFLVLYRFIYIGFPIHQNLSIVRHISGLKISMDQVRKGIDRMIGQLLDDLCANGHLFLGNLMSKTDTIAYRQNNRHIRRMEMGHVV